MADMAEETLQADSGLGFVTAVSFGYFFLVNCSLGGFLFFYFFWNVGN
jgi:hypothetical protein